MERQVMIRYDETGVFEVCDPALLEAVAGADAAPVYPVFVSTNGYCSDSQYSQTYVAINGTCDADSRRTQVVVNGACGANGGCPPLGSYVPNQQVGLEDVADLPNTIRDLLRP